MTYVQIHYNIRKITKFRESLVPSMNAHMLGDIVDGLYDIIRIDEKGKVEKVIVKEEERGGYKGWTYVWEEISH